MKYMVEDLLKFYQAKLLPPDYLTIKAKTWEELVFTNRGFMMPEYIVRVDFFQEPSREQNPDFTLKVMPPPKANIATGQHKLSKQNYEMVGYILCNTQDETRINNALKLFDWMYSEEGRELLSWGKEGETYEIKDGKKQFIFGRRRNRLCQIRIRDLRARPVHLRGGQRSAVFRRPERAKQNRYRIRRGLYESVSMAFVQG